MALRTLYGRGSGQMASMRKLRKLIILLIILNIIDPARQTCGITSHPR